MQSHYFLGSYSLSVGRTYKNWNVLQNSEVGTITVGWQGQKGFVHERCLNVSLGTGAGFIEREESGPGMWSSLSRGVEFVL